MSSILLWVIFFSFVFHNMTTIIVEPTPDKDSTDSDLEIELSLSEELVLKDLKACPVEIGYPDYIDQSSSEDTKSETNISSGHMPSLESRSPEEKISTLEMLSPSKYSQSETNGENAESRESRLVADDRKIASKETEVDTPGSTGIPIKGGRISPEIQMETLNENLTESKVGKGEITPKKTVPETRIPSQSYVMTTPAGDSMIEENLNTEESVLAEMGTIAKKPGATEKMLISNKQGMTLIQKEVKGLDQTETPANTSKSRQVKDSNAEQEMIHLNKSVIEKPDSTERKTDIAMPMPTEPSKGIPSASDIIMQKSKQGSTESETRRPISTELQSDTSKPSQPDVKNESRKPDLSKTETRRPDTTETRIEAPKTGIMDPDSERREPNQIKVNTEEREPHPSELVIETRFRPNEAITEARMSSPTTFKTEISRPSTETKTGAGNANPTENRIKGGVTGPSEFMSDARKTSPSKNTIEATKPSSTGSRSDAGKASPTETVAEIKWPYSTESKSDTGKSDTTGSVVNRGETKLIQEIRQTSPNVSKSESELKSHNTVAGSSKLAEGKIDSTKPPTTESEAESEGPEPMEPKIGLKMKECPPKAKKHDQTETSKQGLYDVEQSKASEPDSRKPLATASRAESERPESMEPETGLRLKEYPPEAKSEIRKHGQTETRKQGLCDVEHPKPSETDGTTRMPHLSDTETVARVPRQIALQNQSPSETKDEPRSSTVGKTIKRKVEQKECKAVKDNVIDKDTLFAEDLANEPSQRGAPRTVKTTAGKSKLVSSGADADTNKQRSTETVSSVKKLDLVNITAEGGKSSPADMKSIASKPEGHKARFTETKPGETDKEPKSRIKSSTETEGVDRKLLSTEPESKSIASKPKGHKARFTETKPGETDKEPKSRIQSSTETKGVDRKPLSTEPESKSRKTDQLSMKEESRKPGPYEIVGELTSLKKILFHHAVFIHLHTNG